MPNASDSTPAVACRSLLASCAEAAMKRVSNVSIWLIRSGTLPSKSSPPSVALQHVPSAQLRSKAQLREKAFADFVLSHFALSMMAGQRVVDRVLLLCPDIHLSEEQRTVPEDEAPGNVAHVQPRSQLLKLLLSSVVGVCIQLPVLVQHWQLSSLHATLDALSFSHDRRDATDRNVFVS